MLSFDLQRKISANISGQLVKRVGLAALATAAMTLGQPARTWFEVASVTIYAPDAAVPAESQGFTFSPDGVRGVHITIRGCLQWAYNTAEVTGPSWIYQESYDITAKTSAPDPDLRLMMQTLLEDRFKLKVHRETRQSPGGVLVVSKGGIKNLQPIDHSGPFQMKRVDGKLVIRNASMSNLAGVLGSPLGKMPLEKTVDQTGLSGVYDITLDLRNFDPNDPEFAGKYQQMRIALSDFVLQALERNYGLKLERRLLPVETLVVDSGNKTPTEN